MDDERFDQLAKAFGAVGSRRRVVGWLLGGALGLSRFGVAGAHHTTRRHCTPSDNHPCPEGEACRQVGGQWTCQGDCHALGEGCATDSNCCEGLRCCPNGHCESAIDNCDGLD